MSHDLSLHCYLEASRDPNIQPYQYADLEALLSLFWFINPQGESAPRTEQFTFPSRPPEILLVDDEPEIIEVWKMDLLSRGYPEGAIRSFTSGEEVAVYARANHIWICLLDVQLLSPYSVRGAYTSGIRVLRTIKDTSPNAKIILISGFVTYAMVKEAILALGASYHLRKPFEMADVRTIVQWAVDQFPII